MAIFDFTCHSCDTTFEFMTRGDRQPACPSCGGAELRKHFGRALSSRSASPDTPSFPRSRLVVRRRRVSTAFAIALG